MMSRWRLQEQVLDGAMRADGMVEEDVVTTAAGMSSRGGGAVDDATFGGVADDAKHRRRYGGQRRRVGSSPSAGATPTDAAMPLSPLTNDGDDHDD